MCCPHWGSSADVRPARGAADIVYAAVQCERPGELHHGRTTEQATPLPRNGEVFTGRRHDGCLTGGKQVAAVDAGKENAAFNSPLYVEAPVP